MFKANIKENVDLMENLQEVKIDIKASRLELDKKYNFFLDKLEETIKNNEAKNDEIINKNIELIESLEKQKEEINKEFIELLEKQKEEINKGFKEIINNFNNRNIRIEEKMEKQSISIDSLKKNTKIIYIALGVSIVLNLIGFFIS